jgi:RNA polymerase sigma-70 factor, ECF subfamily
MLERSGFGESVLAPAKQQEEERKLVEAAQRDRRRFVELYERHFERVYAFALRRVGRREEAEDITSEVFHRALSNIEKFEWRGAPFAAWLFQIASNEISNRWQRAAREKGNPVAKEAEAKGAGAEEIEQRAQIFRLVDDLPEAQRQVVKMRFAEEKSIHEIACALGKTEGAVKQLQFRALESLREKVNKKPGEAHG